MSRFRRILNVVIRARAPIAPLWLIGILPAFAQEAAPSPAAPPAQNVTLNGKPLPTPVASPEPTLADAVPVAAPSSIPPAPPSPFASPSPAPVAAASEPAATNSVTTGDLPIKDEVTPVLETPKLTDEPLVDAPPADLSPAPLPSQNVTVNLINRLVKKGILDPAEAQEMIAQAQADAEQAKAQADATQYAIEQAAAAQAAAVAGIPAPVTDDTVRVTYVPEVVKTEIRESVQQDLIARAKKEGWIAPNSLPAWVSKIKPFGDIRVRFEGDFFPSGNDNTGAFPNFNAINTGSPFDVTGNQFSPQINVDQNRYRLRLRARFGADVNLGENFSAGLRLATGESNSPVSANQSMGLPYQGQGGNFSKYAIWLDRAFIKYEYTGLPTKDIKLLVGRFDNPFFTTSDIQWSNEIGFDGIAVKANYEVVKGVMPFLTAGIFPFYNTDFNFSSNQPSKFKSYDKWIYAVQLGSNWKITEDLNFTGAVAYYYFQNAEGKLSSPYVPLTSSDASDTDNSRPAFAQKGNTYMAIRNIIPDASNDYGTINQWQYFGLATPYQNLAVAAKFDYLKFEPFVISLSGEFVRNLAFNYGDINAIAVNNRGPNDDDLSDSSSFGDFAGGPNAWIVQMQFGSAALAKRGDWNVGFGYRWVESDAVIDGFTGSDFGGGGTNLKGYTVGANYSLSSNVWLGVKWLSGRSISGPTYKEDIIQFDLNAKF